MWSYSGNPSLNNKDAVRFLIADTDRDEPLLEDEEIDFLISLKPNIREAAVDACYAIVAKYARVADYTEAEISVKASQIAEKYTDLAKQLKKNIDSGVIPTDVGSLNNLNIATGKIVEPFFYRNIFKNK